MSASIGIASIVGGGYYSSSMPGTGIDDTTYTISATAPVMVAAPADVTGGGGTQYVLASQPPAMIAATGAAAVTGGGAADLSQVASTLQQCISSVNQIMQTLQAMQGAATPAPSTPTTTPTTTPVPTLSQQDAQLAQRMNKTVLKGTGLAGKGDVIVAACRKYDIPVDFLLAIFKKEAQYAKSGTLADRNNNPGNLRFATWEVQHGGHPNKGFTQFPTMDDGIRAAAHLLSLSTYKSAVAKRDWRAVISKYAPPSENDTNTYVKQMESWSSDLRSTLGIGDDWVKTSE